MSLCFIPVSLALDRNLFGHGAAATLLLDTWSGVCTHGANSIRENTEEEPGMQCLGGRQEGHGKPGILF